MKALSYQDMRTVGIVFVGVSAILFSTAGLFTKGVEASAWDIIFWRGVFAGIFTTLYIACRGNLKADFVKMGKWGWIAAIASASGTIAFIPAFKHTGIANVALIFAASPMFAALFVFLWIREPMARPVLYGCVLALLGVVLIVNGSLESVNIKGDFLALWMTIAMSFVLVIYRVYPQTPAAGPAVTSSIILLPIALFFGVPFSISLQDMMITATFGLVFAVASVTLAEGAKRLPSGEAGLLGALESPFAILFAWLLFSEVPHIFTILGGVLILTGATGSQYSNWKSA